VWRENLPANPQLELFHEDPLGRFKRRIGFAYQDGLRSGCKSWTGCAPLCRSNDGREKPSSGQKRICFAQASPSVTARRVIALGFGQSSILFAQRSLWDMIPSRTVESGLLSKTSCLSMDRLLEFSFQIDLPDLPSKPPWAFRTSTTLDDRRVTGTWIHIDRHADAFDITLFSTL
jgi:hypothetical protein